ncbi:hypothetical protein [Tannockella kyphosi]|uniref:hypothetical protein n=1 Tax=Tannockella kyphosi TaxID=2899121 RepID=UPI0020133818|nr:hypothetical protein [Tannockella kyphosi]
MKVAIVHPRNAKKSEVVSKEVAKWARSYSQVIEEYNPNTSVDLIVIVFDEWCFDYKTMQSFIKRLSRDYVKNICIINTFYITNKRLDKVVKLCQGLHLPLMREQYSCKLQLKNYKVVPREALDGARLYVEDMVHIIQNYY